jgi:hypothetical protein
MAVSQVKERPKRCDIANQFVRRKIMDGRVLIEGQFYSPEEQRDALGRWKRGCRRYTGQLDGKWYAFSRPRPDGTIFMWGPEPSLRALLDESRKQLHVYGPEFDGKKCHWERWVVVG